MSDESLALALEQQTIAREIATTAVRNFLLLKLGREPWQEETMAEYACLARDARAAVGAEKKGVRA